MVFQLVCLFKAEIAVCSGCALQGSQAVFGASLRGSAQARRSHGGNASGSRLSAIEKLQLWFCCDAYGLADLSIAVVRQGSV